MPVNHWRYTADIKQHLNDAESGEEFFKVRAAVAGELKKAPDYQPGTDLYGIVADLETAINIEQFNEALDELYDWAEFERVWLGLLWANGLRTPPSGRRSPPGGFTSGSSLTLGGLTR
jgi:hypothetical protein